MKPKRLSQLAAPNTAVHATENVEPRLSGVLRMVLDAVPLLALALATYLVFAKPFWLDEVYTAAATSSGSVDAMIQHWIANDVHPPLHYLLEYALVRLFGWSEPTLRLPSLVAFAGTIVLLRITAKPLLGAAAARIATSLFASAYFVLNHAYEARGYALLMMLAAWACLCFLSLRERAGSRAAIGLSVSTILMSYTHYFGALLGASLFVVLLLRGVRDRRVLAMTLTAGIASAIFVLPLIAWHARGLVHVGTDNLWIPAVPLWYGAMVAALSCFGGLHGPLVALPAAAGLLPARSRAHWRDDAAIDLIVAVIVGVIVILLVSLRVPVIITRYFSPFMVATFIAAAMLIARLRSPVRELCTLVACAASLVQAIPGVRLPVPMMPLLDVGPMALAWRDASERIMRAGVHRVLFVYDGAYIPAFDETNVAAMGATFFRHDHYPVEVIARRTLRDGSLPLGSLPRDRFAVLRVVNYPAGAEVQTRLIERLRRVRRTHCDTFDPTQPQLCFVSAREGGL